MLNEKAASVSVFFFGTYERCVCVCGECQNETGGYLDVCVSLCLCGASAFKLKLSQQAGSSSVRGEAEAMRSLNESSVNEVGGGRDERRG